MQPTQIISSSVSQQESPHFREGGGGVETSCLSRNEGDLFEEMWNNGLSEGSPMNSIKISWDTVPYRDEEFKRRTIDAIGLDQWNKEYEFWV